MMQTGARICLSAAIAAVLLVPQLCSAQGAPPADLKALAVKYEQGLAVIKASSEKALQDWPQGYVAELKKVEQKLQASGDLDGLLAVRKESERFGKEKNLPESAVVTCPVLRELQIKWRKVPETFDIDKSRQIVLLSRSHIAVLEDLKKKLTVQGKVDEAIAAKDEVDRVRTSAPVTAAEFVLANAGVALTPDGGKEVRPADGKSPDAEGDDKAAAMAASLRASLVVYYSFDRDEGNKVTDKSGKGHEAKVQRAKWTSKGKVGGAYNFNNGWIKASGFHPVTGGGDWTVSLWTKATSADWASDLIGWGLTDSAHGMVRIEITSDVWEGPGGRILFQDSTGRGNYYGTSSSVVTDGDWHFVTVSCAQHMVKIWIDGIVESTFGPIASIRAGHPLTLGTAPTDHRTYGMHGGSIDEVMIFNRALSKDEVKRIYDSHR